MNIQHCTRSALLAAALLLPSAAMAVEETANLTVTLTIEASCTLDAATLTFGPHTGAITTPLTSDADLTVTCTPGATYTLGFGNGSNHDGGTRRMKHSTSTDYVKYQLYKDSTYDTVLEGTTVLKETDTLKVYGRVEDNQTPPVGTYNDTVVMTLTY